MNRFRKTLRNTSQRLGGLLLLFQRSPFVQMLLPEAKIAGLAGGGEAAKWTVATIAGLGAYDSVSGASQISQLYPQANSTTVNTAVGASLEFVPDTASGTYLSTAFTYQVTGTIGVAGSWSIDFPVPPGLEHANSTGSFVDYIRGTPTEQGEYPIRVTAWRDAFQTGPSITQDFTIIVGPPVITTHPASAVIASGSTRTLTVAASGSPLTHQWFTGITPNAANKIAGATSASYTTPALSSTSSYLVMVKRGTIVSFSNPATLTVSSNNTFADWRNASFTSQQLADPQVSGPDADPDGDGFPNTTEYIFGTLPLVRDAAPLTLAAGDPMTLSFVAKAATGAGYNGRTRHYALETSPSLAAGSWTSPADFSDITGTGQTVTHTAARGTSPSFYRLRVWLTP